VKDYYEILGIEYRADFSVIKQRYRALVRENHPDIAEDKDAAHARMQLILEAYTVLSDVEKRSAYDYARQKREGAKSADSAQASSSRPSSRVTPRPMQRPNTARPYGAPSTYGGRGGPASRSGPRTAGAAYSTNESASSATNTRTRLLTMVFDAANLYFEDGRVEEAISICERVMKSDPSNAEAPALLGDIYADQGRIDLALMNYERAVRRQPHNLLYRQKWDELKSGSGGLQTGSNTKNPKAAKAGGCGGQLFVWVFLFVTALTPLVIYILGE
jgi:curved DNA-binding protein CbpA